MTADVSLAAAPSVAPLGSGRLLGLGNVLRKDVGEWLRGRRFWIVTIVSTVIYALTAANAWINDWVLANLPAAPGQVPPTPLPMDPMSNMVAPLATQFFILATIFATISLVISERESGTLAWTVSKPVSRSSVLVSKWLSATGLVWLSAVAIPLAATVPVVVGLYGQPDLTATAVLGLGLAAVVAVYAAITIAASTYIPSQAGVAAVGLAAFILPVIVVGIYPPLGAFMPTAIGSVAFGLAAGEAVSIVTPIAWVLALGLLFAAARARFASMEL
jgi:ABC-type transport system involved in multi-copper enzyme maturation permease subunit